MIGGRPTLTNVSMTSANTEYSYALPSGTSKALIKLRDGTVACKLGYVSGASGTTYLTIPAGSSKEITDIKGTGITLYFQSASASQVLEVEVWQ